MTYEEQIRTTRNAREQEARHRRYYKTNDGHVFMVKNGETKDVTKQYKDAHKKTKEKYPDLLVGTIPYQDKFYEEFYSSVK